MNFRELAEVVAHAGVVAKIHLGNHDDDADGGEDEHHLVEGKIARVVIIALKHKKWILYMHQPQPCRLSRYKIVEDTVSYSL